MEMNKKNKIFLSFIAVVMLILSMFPITAFAGITTYNQDLYDQLIEEGWSDSTSVYTKFILYNNVSNRFIICMVYKDKVSYNDNTITCTPTASQTGGVCYEFSNGVYYVTTYDDTNDEFVTSELSSAPGMISENTYVFNVYGFSCTQVRAQFYDQYISESNSFRSFFSAAELNSFLMNLYQISFSPLLMEIVNILPILLVVLIALLGIRKAWRVVYQNLAQA